MMQHQHQPHHPSLQQHHRLDAHISSSSPPASPARHGVIGGDRGFSPLKGRSVDEENRDSLLLLDTSIPYDDEEAAEDRKWNELQRGTPYKHDLRGMMNTAGLETTPARLQPPFNNSSPHHQQQQQYHAHTSTDASLKDDSDWPWPRGVDTWSTVVNHTTPQRVLPHSFSDQQVGGGATGGNMTGMHGTGSAGGIHGLGGLQQQGGIMTHNHHPHPHHQHHTSLSGSNSRDGSTDPPSYHHSASAWSTDAEDADTEQEQDHVVDCYGVGLHVQNQGYQAYQSMANLSLNDEFNDYNTKYSQTQQQQQQQHQPQHQVQNQHGYQQQQGMNPLPQPQHQPQPQQPHSYSHPHYAPPPNMLYSSAPPSLQANAFPPSFPPVPGSSSLSQSHPRHPSPPPSYTNLRPPFGATPGTNTNPAGFSSLSIPTPVLRSTSNPFQSGSTFSHSTSGPVRGMPTNQVNYSHSQQHGFPRNNSAGQQTMPQPQQQQQQQQQQQVHSQPLTPVGSFGSSHSSSSIGSTYSNSSASSSSSSGQSHSHPASPTMGAFRQHQQPQQQQQHHQQNDSISSNASSVSSNGNNTFPANNGITYSSTPSPLASPMHSPQPSPIRSYKTMPTPLTQTQIAQMQNMQNMQQQQQQNMMMQQGGNGGQFQQPQSSQFGQPQQPQYHQQQGQQQYPHPNQQQHPNQQHYRSNSSGTSLSSSGSSTPTSQVGPTFLAQAQQVIMNYPSVPGQQQQVVQQQQHHTQQRRPMPIQTGHAYGTQYSTGGHPNSAGSHNGGNSLNNNNGGNGGNSNSNKQQGGPSSSPNLTGNTPILSGDSPTSKARFKTFYKDLWALARDTNTTAAETATGVASNSSNLAAEKAYEFGLTALKHPEHDRIQWKIAMELADLAKRQNHIPRARYWYCRAHTLEPQASQVWIEHAKMEEECGELLECERLMHEGLRWCEYNEALMIKTLKHHERMGDIQKARTILAKLKDQPLERVWRTVLEGALMEGRIGQIQTARRVMKYLISNVYTYGPVYYEYAKLEERWGNFQEALSIVEKGLNCVSRYGPLWFMALRLIERTNGGSNGVSGNGNNNSSTNNLNLFHARQHVSRALNHISSELIWKIYFELAQMEGERFQEFDRARENYANAINACPVNLRWKIWLSGARMELLTGDASRHVVVRALLQRAEADVPKKMKSCVALELSRCEEFLGNLDVARRLLKQAQKESKHEWKIFLESVLLELRAGNIDTAIEEAEQALEVHNGTGRLWAILIQLKQKQRHALGRRLGHTRGSMKSQWEIFKLAIKEVPKSGEVWCEGARLVLNPYAPRYFNLKCAKRFLNFAIQFTPQYGDSFIEYLRLKMILEGIEEIGTNGSGSENMNNSTKNKSSTPLYTAANAAAAAASSVVDDSASASTAASSQPPVIFHSSGRITPDGSTSTTSASSISHFSRVSQLCVNAEPNYGSSWFACKIHPLWAPVEVLEVARKSIEEHLVKNQHQYQIAILRNWYEEKKTEEEGGEGKETIVTAFQQQLDEAASSHEEDEVESMRSSSVSPSSPSSSVISDAMSDGSLGVDISGATAAPGGSDASRGLFSPTTVRQARLVEYGETTLLSDVSASMQSSRSMSPNSYNSATLTSEDDEDDLQPEYQADAELNSLQALYPPIEKLSIEAKYRCLYGADPLAP